MSGGRAYGGRCRARRGSSLQSRTSESSPPASTPRLRNHPHNGISTIPNNCSHPCTPNSRILSLTPGHIPPSSYWSRSTKPWVSVAPPVTTMLESRVACRSGSIWTSELEKSRPSGCRAEYGWDGIVEAELGRGHSANCGRGEGQQWLTSICGTGMTDLLREPPGGVEQDLRHGHPHRAIVRVEPVRKFERPGRLHRNGPAHRDKLVSTSSHSMLSGLRLTHRPMSGRTPRRPTP